MALRKKEDSEKRDESIVVKVTKTELEMAHDVAKQKHTTVSELVRTCMYTHKGHL